VPARPGAPVSGVRCPARFKANASWAPVSAEAGRSRTGGRISHSIESWSRTPLSSMNNSDPPKERMLWTPAARDFWEPTHEWRRLFSDAWGTSCGRRRWGAGWRGPVAQHEGRGTGVGGHGPTPRGP
jgi:hypothetical protein